MRSCFPKAFETDKFLSHSNEPSSLLELTHQFLYEREIGFKLINIQLCEAKISVMRVRCRTPAKSKRELFLRIVKEWILSKTFTKSCILNVTVILKRMKNNLWIVLKIERQMYFLKKHVLLSVRFRFQGKEKQKIHFTDANRSNEKV